MFMALLRTLWLVLIAGAAMGAAPPPRGPLVLAASSLQEAMTAAADAWARGGRPRPIVSFAASSALARQMMAGARADLFVSADEEWMDAVAARGLVRPGTRSDLAGNRLVLVAPLSAARGSVRLGRGGNLAAVLGAGRLAIADPAAVPAGRYGQAALERLGDWPAVAGRLAKAENVRAALALVERGAAPLGVVYATDARASRQVRVVAVFPAGSHPPIRYPLAVLTASSHPDAAGFRAFLLSARGRAILRRHGFLTK